MRLHGMLTSVELAKCSSSRTCITTVDHPVEVGLRRDKNTQNHAVQFGCSFEVVIRKSDVLLVPPVHNAVVPHVPPLNHHACPYRKIRRVACGLKRRLCSNLLLRRVNFCGSRQRIGRAFATMATRLLCLSRCPAFSILPVDGKKATC